MTDGDRTAPRVAVVAEDDEPIRHLIEQCLELEGWTVHGAADGETAVELVERHRPVLVVLDIMMPHTDGITALQAIRRTEWGRRCVIVLLTALTEERNIADGIMAGADDYITKPFDPDDLVGRFERFVRAAGWRLTG